MRHIRRATESVGRKLCVSDTMREQLRYEDEIRREYEARGIGVDRRASSTNKMRAPTVEEMHDRTRWVWEEMGEGLGWRVWYRDQEGREYAWYEIRESSMLREIEREGKIPTGGLMWGVYAARCFHKGSRVLVYVGEEIKGASKDEMVNKFVQRVRKGGGRHVMEIGRGTTARFVDGIDGFTGAQFVNI